MERYNTIYVDPPWGSGKLDAGRLKTLPVRGMSQENALLFLWFPARDLPGCLSLLGTWGFGYVQLMTWMDTRKETEYWFRHRCEHLLVGLRGIVRIDYLLMHNLFDWAAEPGEYHPEYFRHLAFKAASRAFDRPELLDVFGGYWSERYPEYEMEDWKNWDRAALMVAGS